MENMMLGELRTYRNPRIPVDKITGGAGFSREELQDRARQMNLAEDRSFASDLAVNQRAMDDLGVLRNQRMLLARPEERFAPIADRFERIRGLDFANNIGSGGRDPNQAMNLREDMLRRGGGSVADRRALEARDNRSDRMLLAGEANKTAIEQARLQQPQPVADFYGSTSQGDVFDKRSGQVSFQAPRKAEEDPNAPTKVEPFVLNGKPVDGFAIVNGKLEKTGGNPMNLQELLAVQMMAGMMGMEPGDVLKQQIGLGQGPGNTQTPAATANDGLPVMTPEQARNAPPGTKYKTTDGRILVR